MQNLEYKELVQIRSKGSIEHYWSDHHNWNLHPILRLARASEEGWEFAGVYAIERKEETWVHFILKHHVLL